MAFVTALVTAIGLTGFAATVATFAIKTVLSIGVSKLLGNRAGKMGAGAQPAGSRQQLPPATDNKLPVIYGTAFVGPSITDAKISSDNKTMWYVCTFAEVTDTTAGSGYTFDQIYYDGKLVTFDGTDPAKVISLTTNGDPPQVDTKIAGNIFIYLFPNGSSSGTNTGGQTAIQLLSDASIPSDQRWNGPIYTTGGQSATMTNTCFAIVKVIYNQDAGTTSLGQVQAKLTNAISGNPIKPGAVIKDYMLNTRYGCAIPLAQIDTDSLDDLDTYSDGLIDYIDDTGNPAQQVRYRINGPLDTGTDCLSNLQQLVDACDSWLQYSELSGKWSVVLNKSYLQSPNAQTINDLFIVNDDNLIGGIDISPVDLNGTFNQLEVQYPNTNIKDQTDYSYIDLFTEYPALVNTNEPVNKLNVQFQIVNNYVQATYLGIRRLLQSREDLVIAFQLDYSGIQLDAGDIVRVYSDVYGWNSAGGFADGKLFRVSNVIEQKYEDGSLGAAIQAFEYSEGIYDDDLDITDFVPSDNTGLQDPNIITQPDPPTIVVDTANTTYNMTITGVVPTGGLVYYLDFNVGNSSNSANHLFYSSVNNANGAALLANTSISITSNDLPPDTLYWSVTAKNNQVGVRSNSSASVSWAGSGVTDYDGNANTGGLSGNNYQPNSVSFTTISNSVIALNTIGSTGYVIASSPFSSPTLPVNITTAPLTDPVYIIGANVDPNYYFPYYQGTSTTANGYYANSTGQFTPAGADFLTLFNGDDNWYAFTAAAFTQPVVAGSEYLKIEYSLQVVTNESTIIQILPSSTDIPAFGYITDSQQIQSYELTTPNVPYYINGFTSSIPTGYDPAYSILFIKNLGNTTSNVIITASQTEWFRGKL